MKKEKKELGDIVRWLWQGKAIDIEALSNTIDRVVSEIMTGVSKMTQRGVEFPVEYVLTAMKNISDCIASRDDFRLADCISYEWLEIIGVYEEVMMELG